MKWVAFIIVLAGLAGCAAVPAELRENGIHYRRVSQNEPAGAILCVTRNAEFHSGAPVELRWDADGSRSLEINVRSRPGELVQAVAAIRVKPSDTGSIVDMWFSPSYPNPGGFADRLMASC